MQNEFTTGIHVMKKDSCGENMNKKSIYIDSDGFFWPKDIDKEYMKEERRGIKFLNENLEQGLFELYYLGFRSNMVICEENLDNLAEVQETIKQYNQACIYSAITYMKNHNNSQALPIDFMWITKKRIVEEIKNEYPEVENIELLLSMKPCISAYTTNENVIVFPALIRSVLKHFNLMITNTVFRIMDSEREGNVFIDRQELARFILPYVLFCHDDVSVANLPIIGGYSRQSIITAFQYTDIQMMFIFAHEYAHILLKHSEHMGNKEKCDIEKEADLFALNVVLRYIEKDDSYTLQDVFTSIRWLFKYQLLEDSTGVLIRRKKLDFYKTTYEERRSTLQSELINRYGLNQTTKLDAIGFMAIVELQGVIYEYGADLINDIFSAFKKSKKIGGIEPWWEKISEKSSR